MEEQCKLKIMNSVIGFGVYESVKTEPSVCKGCGTVIDWGEKGTKSIHKDMMIHDGRSSIQGMFGPYPLINYVFRPKNNLVKLPDLLDRGIFSIHPSINFDIARCTECNEPLDLGDKNAFPTNVIFCIFDFTKYNGDIIAINPLNRIPKNEVLFFEPIIHNLNKRNKKETYLAYH